MDLKKTLVIRHEKCRDPHKKGCQNMVKNPIFQDILTYYDPIRQQKVEEFLPTCILCFHKARKNNIS